MREPDTKVAVYARDGFIYQPENRWPDQPQWGPPVGRYEVVDGELVVTSPEYLRGVKLIATPRMPVVSMAREGKR